MNRKEEEGERKKNTENQKGKKQGRTQNNINI
jgi:hypothetical protein